MNTKWRLYTTTIHAYKSYTFFFFMNFKNNLTESNEANQPEILLIITGTDHIAPVYNVHINCWLCSGSCIEWPARGVHCSYEISYGGGWDWGASISLGLVRYNTSKFSMFQWFLPHKTHCWLHHFFFNGTAMRDCTHMRDRLMIPFPGRQVQVGQRINAPLPSRSILALKNTFFPSGVLMWKAFFFFGRAS